MTIQSMFGNRREILNDKGRLHCDDGPAVIHTSGLKEWYRDGVRHRTDGPAVERPNGDKEWYQAGQLHREDGPAQTGLDSECWYTYGRLNRVDGPAVFKDKGRWQQWYRNGVLHREDGPAVQVPVMFTSGTRVEWFWHGNHLDMPTVKLMAKYKCITDKMPFVGSGEGGLQIIRCFRDADGLVHNSSDDPAVLRQDGTKEWWEHGRRHRSDAPAVQLPTGEALYYLRSIPLTKEEFDKRRNPYGVADASNIKMSNTTPINETRSSTEVAPDLQVRVATEETKVVKKPEIKDWSEDPSEIVNFDEVWTPLKAILEKGYNLVRKNEWKFEYSGYDFGKMERRILPTIKHFFGEKYLRTEKDKHNRTLMDVTMRAVFAMGIEQGRRISYQEQQPIKDLQKTLENYRERNKSTRYQLARANAIIKVRDENPAATPDVIAALVKIELEKTRLMRIQEVRKEIQMDSSLSCFKQRVKKKTKLSDLMNLAGTLDPEIFAYEDWLSLLKDADCSVSDWKQYCKKHKFHKFTGEAK